MIKNGVLPRLLANLSSSYATLLDQTLKCLADIAVDFPERVIEAEPPETISSIASLLLCSDEDVIYQAAVFIGNLCASTFERKQIFIDAGVLHYLKVLLNYNLSVKTLEVIYTLFDNIANGNEAQKQVLFDHKLVEPVIRHMKFSNIELAKSATWALLTLANGATVQQKQRIIDLQALPIIVKLLTSKDEKLAEFAACGLKYIAESEEDVEIPQIIQAIITAGVIPPLTMLLKSQSTSIVDEALGVFIHITACDSTRCQDVLDAGVLSLTKKLLKHRETFGKQLVMALLENMTSHNAGQVDMVVEAEIVPYVLTFLDKNDSELQKVSLLSYGI